MTEKSEEITERFNEKQYIIRVKHASNEKKQYRFFFICEKCNHRERLSNKTLFDINNHKCIKTQEKITTYSQYSPSPLTEAQIRLICKLNISFRAGTSEDFYEYSRKLFTAGQESITKHNLFNIRIICCQKTAKT